MPFNIWRRTDRPRTVTTDPRRKRPIPRDPDLWRKGPAGSGLRLYICPTCKSENIELVVNGVPLVCKFCGNSFMVHPTLPVRRPAVFDPEHRNPDNPLTPTVRREVLE